MNEKRKVGEKPHANTNVEQNQHNELIFNTISTGKSNLLVKLKKEEGVQFW